MLHVCCAVPSFHCQILTSTTHSYHFKSINESSRLLNTTTTFRRVAN